MKRASPRPSSRSLPPTSERLLALYPFAWFALAAIGLAMLGWSFVRPTDPVLILLLRGLKAAALLAVAAILLRRRRKDPVAALLSLAFLLWIITSSVDFTQASSLPVLLDRLRFLLFALALLLFPDARWQPVWTRQVALASATVFLIGAVEALGLLPTRLFLPLAIACVIAAIIALVLRFRMAASETQRQQLKWVALGLVSGVGLILSARSGAALSQGADSGRALILEAMFQAGIILVALGFLVSLLRYRLFDAEAAITRSAAYVGLTAAVVVTFAASEALIEALGQRYFGQGIGDVSAAVAAAIAAVLLNPLHDRISAWAEHRFERDLALLKQQLPDLLAELSSSSSTRKVAATALPRIASAIHALRAAIIVDGQVVATAGMQARQVRGWTRATPDRTNSGLFHRDRANALLPLGMALRCPFGTTRGWLLLGPRPDGSFYGKHELAALDSIAGALRRALFAAKAREEESRRDERTLRALRREVRELAAQIDMLSAPGRGAARQRIPLSN